MPLARLRRDREEVELWWQRPLWEFTEGRFLGRYAEALRAASLSTSHLRPDFVLIAKRPAHCLLVEVKLTQRDEYSPDRRGIVDALAYLQDADQALTGFPEPHALVIAWNSKAAPAPARVVVANQDEIELAMTMILDTWAMTEMGLTA